MNNPEIKIRMMKRSLECFALGLTGLLLPFLGMPFALAALMAGLDVPSAQRHFWNPARRYWIVGMICAALGAFLWGSLTTLMLFRWVQSME